MAARTVKAASEELTLFEKLRKEVNVPSPLRVTSEIVLECPTKNQVEASQSATTEEESNKLLLGEENYNKLADLFGDEAPHLWAKFNEEYLAHFFAVPTAQ